MGKLILNGKEYIRSIPSPFPPIIYSKEEREVGVWTDGKPLYEITVEISDLNYTTALSNKSIYTNQSFDKVISMKGYFSNSAKNRYYNLNYASPDTDKNTIFWYDPVLKTVFFLSDDTWGDSELVITIQYTKSTDTSGSGTWTKQGVLAHHYSTSEQVIGTWINGKPIYEKTIVKDNYRLEVGANQISLGVTNIEIIDSNVQVTNSSHTSIRKLNHRESSGTDNLYYLIYYVAGYINIYAEATWGSPNIYITIQYTKTTD